MIGNATVYFVAIQGDFNITYMYIVYHVQTSLNWLEFLANNDDNAHVFFDCSI